MHIFIPKCTKEGVGGATGLGNIPNFCVATPKIFLVAYCELNFDATDLLHS